MWLRLKPNICPEDLFIVVLAPYKKKLKKASHSMSRHQKVCRKKHNGSIELGSPNWIAVMHKYPPGPATIEEVYSFGRRMADCLVKFEHGALHLAIDMLRFGIGKYSDVSGIRFDDEAFLLLKECLQNYLSPGEK